ncbi:hypothetical protein CVT24_008789 [Panaeolus cyanescens]|uniref:Uncharacterized protein n=1 Tax=Panaeolus cyanescens TaxID=181874 RepID=A0A409VB38_9AGAR|nr:hypothetical protein CVT24_008789 [Panaeolus cyanescens]
MSIDPSWRPQEDEFTILSERTWLAGIILSAVAYGIVFTLFVLSFRALYLSINRANFTQKLIFLVYITLIFTFGTLIIGFGSKMTQLAFIDGQNIPGGPGGCSPEPLAKPTAAFEQEEFAIPIDEVANVCYVLGQWFADGMVVWRCLVIYRSCRYPSWLVMGVPILAYLGSIFVGVVWLQQISTTNPWVSGTNFTLPYFWLSLALNIAMTIAICGRLMLHRWRMRKALGSNAGADYTGIVTMLIESSALYACFSLCVLIPFALNSPIQNTFIQMLGEVQIIAPLLIVYCVASGQAWSSRTSDELMSRSNAKPGLIKFAPNTSSPSTLQTSQTGIKITKSQAEFQDNFEMKTRSSDMV